MTIIPEARPLPEENKIFDQHARKMTRVCCHLFAATLEVKPTSKHTHHTTFTTPHDTQEPGLRHRAQSFFRSCTLAFAP